MIQRFDLPTEPAAPPASPTEAAAARADEQFCQDLTAAQTALLSFVMSLIRDPHLARDIVQDTNLVLWRKRKSYQPELSFRTWALRFAYLQTLAALKARRRSRLTFDQSLVDQLVQETGDVYDRLDERFLQLRECLRKLPRHQRDVVRLRYRKSRSLAEVAKSVGRSVNAVSMTLHRARLSLMHCLRSQSSSSGTGLE